MVCITLEAKQLLYVYLFIYLLNKYSLLFYYVLSASAGDITEVKKDILSGQPILPRTPNHSLYCVNIALQEGRCKLLMLGVEEKPWRIT